ncbi:hypothetical protein EFL96_06295 [Lactococcus lactis]|uniref:hypothetical protein n=2 Tax=Lactococcus lactis TaxID=1358 RepID=UPI00223B48BA|nr:hypothetical protein [Lactococcus lactis]MCT1174164.1 hypothetical protein [Lactococcus lactis]MCT1186491.1 hypothetical protein [Lactococcus lactis]MCT1189563.1 hypothetical protein [Lactococcus lactis]MCT1195261.1 hypothetical protein [Lactococcus lactis]
MNKMLKAVERLYRDRATIKGYTTKKIGSITKAALVTVVEDQPCKVSLKSQKATEQGIAAQIDYDAKLYLPPDLDVPDGAEIIVTGINGRVTDYVGSRPFGYASHQEIYLKYKDKVR